MSRHRATTKTNRATASIPSLAELPQLATPEQIGAALQCTSRTVLNWSKGPAPKIPTAFQLGRIIRFNPRDVAVALGLPLEPFDQDVRPMAPKSGAA